MLRAPLSPQHEAEEERIHRGEASVFDGHPRVEVVPADGAVERERCGDIKLRDAVEHDDKPIEMLRQMHVERRLCADNDL